MEDQKTNVICALHDAELALKIVPRSTLFSSMFIDYTLKDQQFTPDHTEILHRYQLYYFYTYQSFDAFFDKHESCFKSEFLSQHGQDVIRDLLLDHYHNDKPRREVNKTFKGLLRQGFPAEDTLTFYRAIRTTIESKQTFVREQAKYWTGMYKTSKYVGELLDEAHFDEIEPLFRKMETDNDQRKSSQLEIITNIKKVSNNIYGLVLR